tara:strand:+ start:103 stop:699 length:597 start_codon:yes stop_codon:yes gene_type:complete
MLALCMLLSLSFIAGLLRFSPNDNLFYRLRSTSLMSLPNRLVTIIASLTLLIVFYHGGLGILSILPYEWGGVSNNGYHSYFSIFIASLFSLFTGLCLLKYISQWSSLHVLHDCYQIMTRELSFILEHCDNKHLLIAKKKELQKKSAEQSKTLVELAKKDLSLNAEWKFKENEFRLTYNDLIYKIEQRLEKLNQETKGK